MRLATGEDDPQFNLGQVAWAVVVTTTKLERKNGMKTAKQWAELLNGRQYRKELSKDEQAEAASGGMLIAFGASDDLLELRGTDYEEIGSYDGGTVDINLQGKAIVREDDIDYQDLVSRGWTPPELEKPLFTIDVEWCPSHLETSWLITANVPFESFDIMEDEKLHCRGIVVDVKAAALAAKKAGA
jgi:hypothetical protein